MDFDGWWGRVEKDVADANDDRVWLHNITSRVFVDYWRREVADPVMDMLLKTLQELGKQFFDTSEDYKTSGKIAKAVNYSEFESLFKIEQDARPWAQLARTAYLMRQVRRCILYIKAANGGDNFVHHEWESELNEMREIRINRLKAWRRENGEEEANGLSHAEGRELWMLLSYSLKRSRSVDGQQRQPTLAGMLDGELNEAEVAETMAVIGMLKTFECGEVPACFVPAYEVTVDFVSESTGNQLSPAHWGDAVVSVRAVKYNTKTAEPAGFSEEEMLRRSEILSSLHHPNIGQFFGMCHVGTTRFELFELSVKESYDTRACMRWDIWRSCALVLHYLLERGMSYDEFSRDKVFKAHSQNKYVLLGTGISENASKDPTMFPDQFAANMKAFASMIVEDVGNKAGAALVSSVDSAPPQMLDKHEWMILKLFCSSCLSVQVSFSQALFALEEIVRREDGYSSIVENTDQPIGSVKLLGVDEPMGDLMNEIEVLCEDLPNDQLVFNKLKDVYHCMRNADEPLHPLVVNAFCSAYQRFFVLLGEGKPSKEEHDKHSNVLFTILKTLESLAHGLNTDGSASFEDLRSWRAQFCQNYTSLLKKHEAELINLFERTKRSGYPFNWLPEHDNEDTTAEAPVFSKKIYLHPWFIPPYEIELTQSVDTGGFAVVHRGKWFHTEVIVKRVFCDKHHSVLKTCQNNFEREADIWFSLTHPNVIKLYGACSLSSNMFFVCEYARNSHLINFIEASKENNQPCLIWSLIKQAAVALEYLHAHNIIHRDLKCNNILVGNNGCVRLADFGLSARYGEEVEPANGAKMFKAPEVQNRFTTPNASSDVYSLGMCIKEADRTLCQECNLFMQMTHKDPSKRPQVSVVVMRLKQLSDPH